jgi:polyhydroxybutyrate depolymerase
MRRRLEILMCLLALQLMACSHRPVTEASAAVDTPSPPERAGRESSEAGSGARSPGPVGGSAAHVEDASIEASDAALPAAMADADVDAAADGGASGPAACASLAGDDYREIQVGGISRRYLLHVPSTPVAASPLPLVVDLHGLLTHAAFERAASGFAAVADREGFVVAYPEAIDAAWSLSDDDCCAVTPADDVGFVRALVDVLHDSGCLDAKRVYAVGVSAGGGLAQQLGCRAADVFAAVASRDFDLSSTASADCKPARPIAVLSLRDMADALVPYTGGDFRPESGLNEKFRALGAVATFQRWAELDQCQGSAEPRGPGCQAYAACGSGAEVELCTRPDGVQAADAAATWAFLSRFRLP